MSSDTIFYKSLEVVDELYSQCSKKIIWCQHFLHTTFIMRLHYFLNIVDCGKVWEATVQNKLKFPPPLPSLPFHVLFHSQPLAPPKNTDSFNVWCFFPFCTHVFVAFIYSRDRTWKEIILCEYACGTCFSGSAKKIWHLTRK